MVLGGRLPLSGIKEGLQNTFGVMNIDIERLVPNEIRFLQDSMDKGPIWMLENRKAKRAILQSPSSYADHVYRKLFFSRLNPHSHKEMSGFFKSIGTYQLTVYNRLSQGTPFSRRIYLNAWKKATQGTLRAINRGEFNISLSDFYALYANQVSDRLGHPDYFKFMKIQNRHLLEEGRIPTRLHDAFLESEDHMKSELAIVELLTFFLGTIKGGVEALMRAPNRGVLHTCLPTFFTQSVKLLWSRIVRKPLKILSWVSIWDRQRRF